MWRRPPRASGGTRNAGLSLIRADEPGFAQDVSRHGRVDVLVAGQPRQRHWLIHGEQPEYVAVRVIAGRRGWSQVTRQAEAVGSRRRPRARRPRSGPGTGLPAHGRNGPGSGFPTRTRGCAASASHGSSWSAGLPPASMTGEALHDPRRPTPGDHGRAPAGRAGQMVSRCPRSLPPAR